jgi:acyl dehydratase
MSGSLYLEDLHVGQRFTSSTLVVSADEIKEFARQFDPQPFHLDEAEGERSLLGGFAASGWHTAALTMRLLVAAGAPITGGVVGAGVEIKWQRPVRPGDELHVESEVLEVMPSRSKSDRGIAVVRSETLNQRGEVVQILTSRLIVPRRPSR